jgi:DNA primase
MTVIDEVKQKTDIVEVVGQTTKLVKAGRVFKGLCPFHSEKHGSFFVYPEQQTWHCFGACNTGGDVFSFIMKQQGITFGEALRAMADRAGVVVPQKGAPVAEKEKANRLYQANEAAAEYFHQLLLKSPAAEKAREYLARRGLSAKAIEDFRLGYSPNSWDSLKQQLAEKGFADKDIANVGLIIEGEAGKTAHDRFRNKLMFPIFDARGRTAGFGARALDDSTPKYTNSPQTPLFDKSGMLYGLNLAQTAIREQDAIVIVEGYMDVIAAHQDGFNNVVASMGVAITEKHIAIIKKLTRNVILALDSDAAGEEAMLRCIDYEAQLGAEMRVLVLPPGKDPDEVIKEDKALWVKLQAEAPSIVEYMIGAVTSGLNLERAADKSIAADRLLPVIGRVKDPIGQSHYLQKLSQSIGVTQRTLEAALAKSSAGKTSAPKQAANRTPHIPATNPVEDYCLSIMLQHPELKEYRSQILPDYFEHIENREIFLALRESADASIIRENLDETIWPHLDDLLKKEFVAENAEAKLQSGVLRLREIYLKGLEMKMEAVLAEAASEGTEAELAKLQEHGTDISAQLLKVFRQKSAAGHKRGDVDGTG